MDLQMAIDSTEPPHRSLPELVLPAAALRPRHLAVEPRAGPATVEALRAHGHQVEEAAPWSLGRVSAVSRGRPLEGLLTRGGGKRQRNAPGIAEGCTAYVCGR